MKHSKSDVRCKFSALPELRFDDQQLPSFSGLIIFKQLFSTLDLRRRVSRCFEHRTLSPIFSTTSVAMRLIVSALLGYRRLRDVRYFQNDPLVLRILSVRGMSTASTLSRQLNALGDRIIGLFELLQQRLVLDALEREQLSRITLDFDGSVLGTCRHAEGVASG